MSQVEYVSRSVVAGAAFTVKMSKISSFARYFTLAEIYDVNWQQSVRKWSAEYNFFEGRGKTFVIANGQNQNIREDVFEEQPIRRMVLAT